MRDSKEVFRSLSMLTQVSLQLLIPILIGLFGGIGLDKAFHSSPWITVVGALLGIAGAFRNLYVWSVRESHRLEQRERVKQAKAETGYLVLKEEDEDDP